MKPEDQQPIRRRGQKKYYTNMKGDKNSVSKIYKEIHQRRLCSARLEESSAPMTEIVPTNNQRGRGSGPCLL